jgi:hypothetical protein
MAANKQSPSVNFVNQTELKIMMIYSNVYATTVCYPTCPLHIGTRLSPPA